MVSISVLNLCSRNWVSRLALSAGILAAALVAQGCGGGGSKPDPGSRVEGSCGEASPSQVADCKNVDFGSCGNACCNLVLSVKEPPHAALSILNSTLLDGGPDGFYTLQITAGGAVGFDNLTQYKARLPEPFHSSKGDVYIGQVHHETKTKHYVDTVNFVLMSDNSGGTKIHAYSLSLIGGALGDNGQNYKNIMLLMRSASWSNGFKLETRYNNSCPEPAGLSLAETTQPVRQMLDRPSQHLRKDDHVAMLQLMMSMSMPALKRLAAVEGTCGPDSPSKVPDCQNTDLGSCGNACCNLLIGIDHPPKEAVVKLNDTLAQGGPDGQYTLQMTDQGSLGFSNLTEFTPNLPEPYHSSAGGVYIGQVQHETTGKHYKDIVDFNIYDDGKGRTVVHAFSLSLIGGALGDNGQNFKNIIMAMSQAFGPTGFEAPIHLFGSCPEPA